MILDRITEEDDLWTLSSEDRTGSDWNPMARTGGPVASAWTASTTSSTAPRTVTAGLVPPSSGTRAAVEAVLEEHRPVWDLARGVFVCVADGRCPCPCYVNAVSLLEHDCDGRCWAA